MESAYPFLASEKAVLVDSIGKGSLLVYGCLQVLECGWLLHRMRIPPSAPAGG